MSKAKVTLTIDRTLIRNLDIVAKASKESRSHLVELAIRKWELSRLEQELQDGYRSMSEENLKIAEERIAAGYETLK